MGSFRLLVDVCWGYNIAQLKMTKSQVSEAICCNGEQPLRLKHKHRYLKSELRMVNFYDQLNSTNQKPCIKCGWIN